MRTIWQKTVLLALGLIFSVSLSAQNWGFGMNFRPSATHQFATADGKQLYLDIYEPTDGSATTLNGREKPTILYVFGGGFKEGSRSEGYQKTYYREMCNNGYRVIAIDYRLGLKDVKIGLKFISKLDDAINMAVQDLFSATNWLIENQSVTGINPDNIVISGSSAGAITVLQAEWEICNATRTASVLPQGFNYAGVMSYSGAIYSKRGAVKYRKMDPCPHFICHGTADKIVPYKQIAILNQHFSGSNVISRKFCRKDYNYNMLRFEGNGHEIASSMMTNMKAGLEFLERNVMNGEKRIIDMTITDPSINRPAWAKGGFHQLY